MLGVYVALISRGCPKDEECKVSNLGSYVPVSYNT